MSCIPSHLINIVVHRLLKHYLNRARTGSNDDDVPPPIRSAVASTVDTGRSATATTAQGADNAKHTDATSADTPVQ